MSNLTYRKDDVVILDMEAGLEHLGRGTAANMDQFIVVVEPGARSVQTYANVKRLAADLGMASMWLAVFADVGVAVLAILNATRAGR